MNVAIFLGAMTVGLFFVIGIAAGRYGAPESQGPMVSDRFLEKGARYDRTTLHEWVKKDPNAARHYAFPVLFPLDLLFMIFLGGFLGVGSIVCAETIDGIRRFAWLLAVMPAVYVAVDLMEDVLLARLLLDADAITDNSVRLTQATTKIKLVACGLAVVQTIVVSGYAAAVRP